VTQPLGVYIGGRCTGTLQNDLTFAYSEAWLQWNGAHALSQSLPLRDESFDVAARRFFGNLLPEGAARESVCQRLGISIENDFAMLAALGRDCAGALVLTATPPGAADGAQNYRRLEDADLERFEAEGSWLAAALDADVRLSLAGAQDKLPILLRNGALHLPLDSAPSNALLKPAHRTFARLPENELFLGKLAAAIGMPTAAAEPWPLPRATGLLVHRYDRATEGDRIERLHQEDLCQALDYARHAKYESEGGPTFALCYEMVRDVSVQALRDTRALLRWLVFCTITGNRDNHAKNLSLLRDEGWRLAPFYDLVCTRVFPRISSRLAMSIGGRFAVSDLSRQAWVDEAARLEIGGPYLLRVVEETADRIERAMPGVEADTSRDIDGDAIQNVVREVNKGLRSVRRSLR
jgi:serine/threonine-protein kinase HipA